MPSDKLLLTPTELARLAGSYYNDLKGRSLPDALIHQLVISYHDVLIERYSPGLVARSLEAPEDS